MVGERGFTFVEVLVVLVVLATGILGSLQASLLAARMQGRGRAMSAAVFLAQERIERIGALGWERATAGLERMAPGGLLDAPAPLPQETLGAGGVRYLLLLEREAPGPLAPPRCTVHCFWAEGDRPWERRNSIRLSVRRP